MKYSRDDLCRRCALLSAEHKRGSISHLCLMTVYTYIAHMWDISDKSHVFVLLAYIQLCLFTENYNSYTTVWAKMKDEVAVELIHNTTECPSNIRTF